MRPTAQGPRFEVARAALWLALCVVALPARAAEMDAGKLPAPAAAKVDFARDIQPIIETSCLRCHGPEKPKSRFRLDNRDPALRGGAKGVDILPGQSARSPLIHYVARLVEDLEMPPAGKGDPLTREQVALLRAWIDQGVEWTALNEMPARARYSVTPAFRFISVSGNRQKFRELEWLRDGAAGGLEEFSLVQRLDADTKFTAEGRALAGQEDYRVRLSLEKNDMGFVRAGYEQWRRYYDDTGGYYRPVTPSSFSLGRDLHLDLGRAWVEFGLTLPDVPKITLGYEYQFKDGGKSTLQWGPAGGLTPPPAGSPVANVYPAFKDIAERVHILKLDLSHELAGWEWENNFRYEFHDLKTSRDDVTASTLGTTVTTDKMVRFRDRDGQQSLANTLHVEKQLRDWLLVSIGQLYTSLNGNTAFSEQTLKGSGVPATGNQWSGGPMILRRDTHALSTSALFGPWNGLSFSGVVQGEWARQEGFGDINLAFGNPAVRPPRPEPAALAANFDRTSIGEHFALRYTRIPHTVLYAEGRFQQERQRLFEQETGGPEPFLHDADSTRDVKEYRAGLNTSPSGRWSFSAHLKRQEKRGRYDLLPDNSPPTGHSYPGFIRARDILTDEFDARLTWRAANWLRTSLSYQIVATDFLTTTDAASDGNTATGASPGGTVHAGNHDAQVCSVNVTLTPHRRLSLSTTLSYSDARTSTAQNGADYVVPFRGQVYTALNTTTFVLNDATDLLVSYSFSRADYRQADELAGLPAGVDYTHHTLQAGVSRRIGKNVTTAVQYFFASHRDPGGGGVNNYAAHGIFATLALRWP